MTVASIKPSGQSLVAHCAPVPISRQSAAKLPRALLLALTEVRAGASRNTVPVREVYAYAYHGLYSDPVTCAREQRAIRDSLRERGYDVGRLLSPAGLRSYEQAVKRAKPRAASPDLAGVQLARSGKQAFAEHTYLNCLDYAKAVAYRAQLHDPTIDVRFFVTMDVVGYRSMCAHGPSGEPAGPIRPVVHTMVAYRKDGQWWVVSPETDLTHADLEIFQLGASLPARFGKTFRIEDAPFVRGKDLIYAGSYDFADPLVHGAVHPQVLKNIAASGVASLSPSHYVCR